MDRMSLNNQSCANQLFALDPHIITNSKRVEPLLPGSTRGLYPFGDFLCLNHGRFLSWFTKDVIVTVRFADHGREPTHILGRVSEQFNSPALKAISCASETKHPELGRALRNAA